MVGALFAALGRLRDRGLRPGTAIRVDYVSLKHGRVRLDRGNAPGSSTEAPFRAPPSDWIGGVTR